MEKLPKEGIPVKGMPRSAMLPESCFRSQGQRDQQYR